MTVTKFSLLNPVFEMGPIIAYPKVIDTKALDYERGLILIQKPLHTQLSVVESNICKAKFLPANKMIEVLSVQPMLHWNDSFNQQSGNLNDGSGSSSSFKILTFIILGIVGGKSIKQLCKRMVQSKSTTVSLKFDNFSVAHHDTTVELTTDLKSECSSSGVDCMELECLLESDLEDSYDMIDEIREIRKSNLVF